MATLSWTDLSEAADAQASPAHPSAIPDSPALDPDSPSPDTPEVDAASPRLTGRVVRPRDPGYAEARLQYNAALTRTPRAVVFCTSVDDVVHAVRWAVARRVPFRARSGRHSYEAYSSVDGGLVVDVSEMDAVRVIPDGHGGHGGHGADPAATTAVIGAGADLQDVYAKLWQVGVTVPGGSCPSVCIAGLTLGGGFGLLGRYAGLCCDALVGARMVTAAGDVVDASAHTHADLFWALRGGGGGNFGIVTSFTFRVVPIGNVAIYQATWAWHDLPAVVRAWQAWAPATDRRLTSVLALPAKAQGQIRSAGQFVGPLHELRALLVPLLAAAPLVNLQVQTLPFIDAVDLFAGVVPGQETWAAHWHSDQTAFKNTSAYAYAPFGDAAISTLMDALADAPSADNLVQFDAYGGAVADVAPADTAFAHRTALFNLQYQAYWTAPSDAQRNRRWVEAFRRSMLPFTRGGYVNYIDRDVVHWQRYYYGSNFERLVTVKAAWDPANVFRFAQSIPTTAATTTTTCDPQDDDLDLDGDGDD